MLGKRYLLHAGACSIGLLLLSTSAWAQLTGTVYQVPGNLQPATLGAPTGTNLGTFSAGTALTNINFITLAGTLANFMNSDPSISGDAGILGTSQAGQLMSGPASCFGVTTTSANCYSTEIEITGFANLVTGTTYTITHDDGVVVDVNGSSVLPASAANPTAAVPNSFTYTGLSGSEAIAIAYMGTNGDPEVLQITSAAAPEPSSVVMLLSMLGAVAGFAGMLKKKLA